MNSTVEDTLPAGIIAPAHSSYTISSCTSDEPIASTSSSIAEHLLASDDLGATSLRLHERKCSSDNGIHYVDDDDGVEFALDARQLNQVHEELEKLNIATDVINSLEFQLDESRNHFNQIHTKWSLRLDDMKKKYGSAIQKSRPYYEAIEKEQVIHGEAKEVAVRFQRATSMLQVAKLQVKLTQESLSRQREIEPECLEILNQHVNRVATAELERAAAEEAHRAISQRVQEITALLKQLEKDYARSIKKSRHYFDQREEFRRVMDHQKEMIKRLEIELSSVKRGGNRGSMSSGMLSTSVSSNALMYPYTEGLVLPQSYSEQERSSGGSASVPSTSRPLSKSHTVPTTNYHCDETHA